MVYVLDISGKPLMPTNRHRKVRKWLNEGRAKVINKIPFTIQLNFETGNNVQEVNLGVDAGSKHIGLSATTAKKVLFEASVELRTDISKLLANRKQARNLRRQHKTRYRPIRFKNRHKTKKEGWIAPTINQKIDTHMSIINKVHRILPICRIIVEVAQFDTQKLKNPDISGVEYQNGEQKGTTNVREYVLYRDKHTCQCCFGKSNDKILNVHHIESRKTGGNAPNNLITLCKTCHENYHKGLSELPKDIMRGKSYKDAAFMGIMKKTLVRRLSKIYPNVKQTFGYITKTTRIENNLPKEHYVDARCISGNPIAEPINIIYNYKKIRRHNRKLYKETINKGGTKEFNSTPYITNGFRMYDIVRYKNGKELYYISSRYRDGSIDIRPFSNPKKYHHYTYKRLKLYQPSNGFAIMPYVSIIECEVNN